MHVVKVAYTKQHIRRRRQCQGCGVAWTSRERFDGARLDAGKRVVPEGWPVADRKVPRRRKSAIQPDARHPLDEMVRDSYRRDPRVFDSAKSAMESAK